MLPPTQFPSESHSASIFPPAAASQGALRLGVSQSPRAWEVYVLLFGKQLWMENGCDLQNAFRWGVGEPWSTPAKPSQPGQSGTRQLSLLALHPGRWLGWQGERPMPPVSWLLMVTPGSLFPHVLLAFLQEEATN